MDKAIEVTENLLSKAFLQKAVVIVPVLAGVCGIDLVASLFEAFAWFGLVTLLWIMHFCFKRKTSRKSALRDSQALVRLLVDLRNQGIRRELGISQGMTYEQIQILPRKVAMTEEFCSICLTDVAVGEEHIDLACTHKFHAECLENWIGIQPKCPVCKQTTPFASQIH